MASYLLIAWMSVFPVFGGSGTPLPEPTGAEAEIHAVHEKYSEAWNSHDAKALASNWTEDGDYTEPDGRTVHGRAAIEKLLSLELGSVFKESRLTLIVERVRIIGGDVAVTDGSYELFGARDPRGRKIGIRSGYFTTVLTKEDGTWKVSAARLMLPQVLIWREKP